MATWQYDFGLVPKVAVTNRWGTVHPSATMIDVDRNVLWQAVPTPDGVAADFGRFLPVASVDLPGVYRWGLEDGTRIDVDTEQGCIVDIFVRIDVRNSSLKLVSQIVEIAKQNEWLVIASDGKVIAASVQKLLGAIESSPAMKFVADPDEFFESIRSGGSDEPLSPKS